MVTCDSECCSESGSLAKWNVSIWQQQRFSALPASRLEECMRRERESDRWRIGEGLSEGTGGAYGSAVVLCCVNWNVFHHISPSLQSPGAPKQQPGHGLALRRLFNQQLPKVLKGFGIFFFFYRGTCSLFWGDFTSIRANISVDSFGLVCDWTEWNKPQESEGV